VEIHFFAGIILVDIRPISCNLIHTIFDTINAASEWFLGQANGIPQSPA
jgi:hypothetical protein